MTQDENNVKAVVVLTQKETDTAIHGLEQATLGMDDEFREVYGVPQAPRD